MLSRRIFLQVVGASAALAVTGTDFLAGPAAGVAAAATPNGSNGVEHVVVMMMENRSFDHFLSWLPGADGRNDLTFAAYDGNTYPNYPLAPDFQGCGYSDPDHSWEGWLVESNGGLNNGFLQRPTAATTVANTFPVGYYTNLNPDGTPKTVPDLPVIGALAQHYTTIDRYFASFAGETYPNRLYAHAAQTDRDHNSSTTSTLPTIWDQLSPVANTSGVPTGAYFFRDLPFLGLWGLKYAPFWHPVYTSDNATIASILGSALPTLSFFDTVTQGLLPAVSWVDPAFDTESNGTSADDHPFADIRLGERVISDVYYALSNAGYLDNTVLLITFDEWGGFFDHVPPPHVIDTTNPNNVNHTGDSTTPTDGQLVPDYTQLGFRVPAIVVSNLAPAQVVGSVAGTPAGPFEHSSALKLIETTFGLNALTARDANAQNLGQVLTSTPRTPVPAGTVPTGSQVLGPVSDAAAECGANSVPATPPAPLPGSALPESPLAVAMPVTAAAGAGMVALGRHYRKLRAAGINPLSGATPLAVAPSAVAQQAQQDPGAEVQGVDGDPFVHPVE